MYLMLQTKQKLCIVLLMKTLSLDVSCNAFQVFVDPSTVSFGLGFRDKIFLLDLEPILFKKRSFIPYCNERIWNCIPDKTTDAKGPTLQEGHVLLNRHRSQTPLKEGYSNSRFHPSFYPWKFLQNRVKFPLRTFFSSLAKCPHLDKGPAKILY